MSHPSTNLTEKFNKAFYASPFPKTVSSFLNHYQQRSSAPSAQATSTNAPIGAPVSFRSITPPSNSVAGSAGSKRKLDEVANTDNGNAAKKVTTIGEWWPAGRVGHAPLPAKIRGPSLLNATIQTHTRTSEPLINGPRGSSLRKSVVMTPPKTTVERQASAELDEHDEHSDEEEDEHRKEDHEGEYDEGDEEDKDEHMVEAPPEEKTSSHRPAIHTTKLDTLLSSPEKRKREKRPRDAPRNRHSSVSTKPPGPPKIIAEIQSKTVSRTANAEIAETPQRPETNTRRARESTRRQRDGMPEVGRSEQHEMGPPKTPGVRPSRAVSQASGVSSRASSRLGPREPPTLDFLKSKVLETPMDKPTSREMNTSLQNLERIPSTPPSKKATRRRSQRESSIHEETIAASISTPSDTLTAPIPFEVPETPYDPPVPRPAARTRRGPTTVTPTVPTRQLPPRSGRNKAAEIPETPYYKPTTTTTVKEKLGLDAPDIYNTPSPGPASPSPTPSELLLIPEKERRRYSAPVSTEKDDDFRKPKKKAAAKSKKAARKSLPAPAVKKKKAEMEPKKTEGRRRHSSFINTTSNVSSSPRRTRRSGGVEFFYRWGEMAIDKKEPSEDVEMEDVPTGREDEGHDEAEQPVSKRDRRKGKEKEVEETSKRVTRPSRPIGTKSMTPTAVAGPSKLKPMPKLATSSKKETQEKAEPLKAKGPAATKPTPKTAAKPKAKPKPKARDTTQEKSVVIENGRVVKISKSSRPSSKKRSEYDFSDEEG